jgi:hypothetical protein
MTYDPEAVLRRDQEMLESPVDELTEGSCALMRDDAGVRHETIGCEPGGCQSCCVGVVELVRQYSEQQASLETRTFEFGDTVTKAGKLGE